MTVKTKQKRQQKDGNWNASENGPNICAQFFNHAANPQNDEWLKNSDGYDRHQQPTIMKKSSDRNEI